MERSVAQLILSLFFSFFYGLSISAVPACPFKVKVLTANGKTVEIYLRGDEYRKFAVTEDGFTLVSDSIGWWYACMKNAGEVEKSDFKLMAVEDETEELKHFKAGCPKGIVPERQETHLLSRNLGPDRASSNTPIVGERRALVILMQFKDLNFKKSREDFEELFNTLDYKQGGASGSVRDYYRFASQNQLEYISDVYGPYTSQNPMRYYGGNALTGGNDRNALELCKEAIKSLPDDIDFSAYDNDGDGLVDNVHIIYAGYGEESGASSDAIWAHEYPHRITLKNEVGYSFAGYSCSPELRGNSGTNITYIGVICHELGHALGAKDYYDTNYGTGGEYEGTGKWDIMAHGSWNDNGRTPPNFNPYVRSTVFGWNRQVALEANKRVSMPCMEANNAMQSVIYRMDTGSDGDYFLLENRQKIYFDAALPGAGLMIYHVHPNIERYHLTNTVNATHPQGLYPVCASYSEPSKRKYGNINSSECPFPGSKSVRVFSTATLPTALAWNGSGAKVSVSSIKTNTSDGSVSFMTSADIVDEPDIPDVPTEKELIYKESFEAAIADRLTVNSIMGKETWCVYEKGDFAINPEFIPKPSDGENVFMLYSNKGSVINESETIGPDIEVEPGEEYILSFEVCCEARATVTPVFNLFVEDEYGEYNVFNLSKESSEWQSIELPLTFAGNTFRYKLYGKVFNGGIFVDNIRLYKEVATSFIKNRFASHCNTPIYTITGLRHETIRRGINIVKKSDGSTGKIISK